MLRATFMICLLILFQPVIASANPAEMNGEWVLLPQKSSEIGLYNTLSLIIQQSGNELTLIQKWGETRSLFDTLKITLNGKTKDIRVTNRVFPTNVFMGLSQPVGETKQVKAIWEDNQVLKIEENYAILGSQGKSELTVVHRYALSSGQEVLNYKITRSTRTDGPEVQYAFKRAGVKMAYFMDIEDGWDISGRLAENALLISLQGVANTRGAKLYFRYPDTWPFNYTKHVFEFYKNERNYTFTQLKTTEQALKTFRESINGYVVWDKSVRTSLIVAFTVAGLEKSAVVSAELIPLVENLGLKPVVDFRGQFAGQTDAQIFQWAYDHYWERCNKELIIWLGGDPAPYMKPGVADWGIYKQTFFNNLSSKPEDKEEYALANRLLAEMKPMSLVMGWHAYEKDKERDHIKLTSYYGHCVEGLHTLPNLSFSSQVPASPGFKYTNNHRMEPDKKYIPEEKVYITCVQTDGLGIGAWTKPGRGEIPYAWEVIMNYQWLAPAMLEFFYTQATPNDYFIGCLSGPGYMYPKAVQPKFLPPLLARARNLMQKLDLNVFEIMDYSEGATVEGNTELPREVVETYYEAMPEAIGFLNGYAPSYTFTIRDKRPLISYDYYLSPTRPEADAVADLHELGRINRVRPYFLLVHVRESSDVKRVKGIMDKLNADFELVPLDIFLKMAGEKPTFKEKFLKK